MSSLPIRVRVTLAFTLAMTALLAGLGVFLYLRLEDSLTETIDTGLESRAGGFGGRASASEPDLSVEDSGAFEDDETFAQVLNPEGTVLASTAQLGGAGSIDSATFATAQREPTFVEVPALPGLEGELRVLAFPVPAPGGGTRVAVVGASLDDRDAAAPSSLLTLLLIGGPIALLAPLPATLRSRAPSVRSRRCARSLRGDRNIPRTPANASRSARLTTNCAASPRRSTRCSTASRRRSIVLAGAGRGFSAGHDLSEMIGREDGFYAELFDECSAVMQAVHAVPQPVIARVHGIATAAGCQLVAACDLAVADEGARFGTPGVRIGLFCSTPMVPLSRAIGRKRAMQMLLTGELIDAETALDWGLVNQVVPAGELDAAVTALASRIAEASPRTVALGKRAFYAQIDRDEGDAYELTAGVMTRNAANADAQEGMTAFLEKRPPAWPG